MTTTWALPGQRPGVRHEHTQGQRIHVLAAQAAPGTIPTTPLTWVCSDRSLNSEDLKAFLLATVPAGTGQPRVVVLDNAATHRHGAMQDAGPELTQADIALKFLPPYSPQLNDIERTFCTCKHESLPQGSFADSADLAGGVNQAFATVHDRLLALDQPRPDA